MYIYYFLGRCVYTKKGAVKSECDSITNEKNITLVLKKGRDNCAKTKVITRPCKKNRGKRNRGKKGKGTYVNQI